MSVLSLFVSVILHRSGAKKERFLQMNTFHCEIHELVLSTHIAKLCKS